jgi:hypothetical protein
MDITKNVISTTLKLILLNKNDVFQKKRQQNGENAKSHSVVSIIH